MTLVPATRICSMQFQTENGKQILSRDDDVEESMLMQKFNEVMSAQAWLKRVTVEKMLQTIVRVKNLEIQFASQAIKRSIGVNLSELLSHEYLGMLF
ncbi:uncharacterized protein LOC122073915 isoform X3 [Macadamia integrifolia]|uniref:uncharacterized protein LOC122073915 isoform X3 n=1 Tax=Macadamia integrifolia TaxID=60698 RepID=UPI001C5008E1|nr:uncharacterized protein LOC122073915 isoform X3 [Macadamia integrifolia]XP_042494558.1 uncharacterized protein LOC122073915 isoform X3 [Macadamia integrifolia]